MKKLLLLALSFSLLAVQCKKDTTTAGSINIVMKPVFNTKPFVMNQIYSINGMNVKFTRLQFFTGTIGSNVTDTEKKNGTYIQLFSFTDLDDSIKAAAGVKKNVALPLGSANQFTLNLGVDSVYYNALKPKDYANSNPLSDAGQYWDTWNSYIFFKIEGLIDKDGDGKYETGLTLHTGGNQCFRSVGFEKSYAVDTQGSTTLNFELNINTLLRGIDVATVNSTHQTGDLPTMLKIMDNLKEAISLK